MSAPTTTHDIIPLLVKMNIPQLKQKKRDVDRKHRYIGNADRKPGYKGNINERKSRGVKVSFVF